MAQPTQALRSLKFDLETILLQYYVFAKGPVP